jgi:hypothetical protein
MTSMSGLHLATRVGAVITRRRPPAAGAEAARPQWPGQAVAVARRHWLISVLLAAGLVLRVLSLIAYRPAIIYVDTLKYLYGASPGADPLGYRWLLKVVLSVGGLDIVALLQHLAGLAMGAALYLVLVRRGVSRWLAALAAAPVLLDAYEVQIEQMIMADVWFEAMLVAGLVVLLWRPAVTWRAAVAVGLIFGISAMFHQLGEVLFLPAVVYLLAIGGGWRRAVGTSAALLAAFALPILVYCTVSQLTTGNFWLAHGQRVIGRMAAAADCATLKLPATVRPLCPDPAAQAKGPDWLEHSAASPLFANVLPPGTSVTERYALIAQLDTAVEHQQPLRVVVSYLEDSVRLFAATRQATGGVGPISRWQFQASFPVYPRWVTLGPRNVILIGLQRVSFGPFHYYRLNRSYGGPAQVDRPLAAFLRAYQLDGGYTPGPLYLAFTLLGVAGSVLVLARRRAGAPAGLRSQRGLALACLLFTATAATVLLAPDVFEFSWRYQLPALVTLPPAGVLGVAALVSARRAVAAAQPVNPEAELASSDPQPPAPLQ